MSPKTTFNAPTREDIFGTGFAFGHNAPHDSQDSNGLTRITGLSSTSKEEQRVLSQLNEKHHPFDFGELSDYVRTAYEWLSEQPDSEQMDPSTWRSPLFPFARLVKAHPEITDVADHEAARSIERLMRDWNDLQPGYDPWEFFFPDAGGAEAARLDFMTSWNAVRHVPFHDVLSNALRLADANLLAPPHERGRLYQRFISLAGWLQVLLQDKAILLPTRELDKRLGCDQRTVSRMRTLAVQDRLLVIVKKHSYRAGMKSEATEFRFAIERYAELVTRRCDDK